jgi:hypothetical protein
MKLYNSIFLTKRSKILYSSNKLERILIRMRQEIISLVLFLTNYEREEHFIKGRKLNGSIEMYTYTILTRTSCDFFKFNYDLSIRVSLPKHQSYLPISELLFMMKFP